MKQAPRSLRKATMLDTWLMCSQLRPDDIEHYMAYSFLPEWDFEKAAADFWGRPGMKFCYQDADGRPLAVLGLTPVTPGCFDMWMCSPLSTWETSGTGLTRALRWLAEYVFAECGVRRLQVETLASREGACEWYERGLKMRPEGVKPSFGRNGESVACFSRLRGE